MGNYQLFHIIWTTFGQYPIWDKNGNWQTLKNTYTNLQNHNISFNLSHNLWDSYVNRTPSAINISLTPKEIEKLKIDIEELCTPNKDRIINGLEIQMLRINKSTIEILAFSNISVINQKIARLKSRTSTLLSLKYPRKGTWGKGIWYSIIFNQEKLAISIIKNNELES